MRLDTIGPLLFGPQWVSELARALGQFHPRGPRSRIDVRLVHRWISGQRPEPQWLPGALRTLLDERRSALDALAGPGKAIRTVSAEYSRGAKFRSETSLEETS
jgi:hypothetical protein